MKVTKHLILPINSEKYQYHVIFFCRNIEIKMTSEGSWINWLKSTIANIVIPYYEKHIIEIAEKTSLQIAHIVLKYANKNMTQYIADRIFDLLRNTFG